MFVNSNLPTYALSSFPLSNYKFILYIYNFVSGP